MFNNIPNLVGLFGVIVILVWYLMLQTGKCKSEDLSFSVANTLGSICLLYSLIYEWNLPTVVIEIVWLMISIFGIGKSLYLKRRLQSAA